MKPAAQDIDIYQGDSFALYFKLRNKNPDGSPGDYISLAGYTGKCQVRATPQSTSILIEGTVVVEPGAVTGAVLVQFAHADTATVAAGIYVWDVQLTSPTGDVYTYLAGKANVTAEVTR